MLSDHELATASLLTGCLSLRKQARGVSLFCQDAEIGQVPFQADVRAFRLLDAGYLTVGADISAESSNVCRLMLLVVTLDLPIALSSSIALAPRAMEGNPMRLEPSSATSLSLGVTLAGAIHLQDRCLNDVVGQMRRVGASKTVGGSGRVDDGGSEASNGIKSDTPNSVDVDSALPRLVIPSEPSGSWNPVVAVMSALAPGAGSSAGLDGSPSSGSHFSASAADAAAMHVRVGNGVLGGFGGFDLSSGGIDWAAIRAAVQPAALPYTTPGDDDAHHARGPLVSLVGSAERDSGDAGAPAAPANAKDRTPQIWEPASAASAPLPAPHLALSSSRMHTAALLDAPVPSGSVGSEPRAQLVVVPLAIGPVPKVPVGTPAATAATVGAAGSGMRAYVAGQPSVICLPKGMHTPDVLCAALTRARASDEGSGAPPVLDGQAMSSRACGLAFEARVLVGSSKARCAPGSASLPLYGFTATGCVGIKGDSGAKATLTLTGPIDIAVPLPRSHDDAIEAASRARLHSVHLTHTDAPPSVLQVLLRIPPPAPPAASPFSALGRGGSGKPDAVQKPSLLLLVNVDLPHSAAFGATTGVTGLGQASVRPYAPSLEPSYRGPNAIGSGTTALATLLRTKALAAAAMAQASATRALAEAAHAASYVTDSEVAALVAAASSAERALADAEAAAVSLTGDHQAL